MSSPGIPHCPRSLSCLIALVALLFVLVEESLASGKEIRLLPEAYAVGGVVGLADVAECHGFSPQELDSLAQVKLGPAPLAGRTMEFTYANVLSRLRAVGFNMREVELTGASLVSVRNGGAVVQRNDASTSAVFQSKQRHVQAWIERLLTEHVSRQSPELGAVSVTAMLERAHTESLALASRQSVSVAGGVPNQAGEQQFTISYRDQSGRENSVSLTAEVSRQPFVLSVGRSLPRGHLIRRNDLIWVQVEETGDYFADAEQLVGRETVRPLREEMPIRQSDVRRQPVIRPNEVVRVRLNASGIIIERDYRSRDEGAVGDWITLESLDRAHKEKISARVVGFGRAEIDLSRQRLSPEQRARRTDASAFGPVGRTTPASIPQRRAR